MNSHLSKPRPRGGKASLPRAEIRRHRLLAPWTYERLDERQREIARRLLADPSEEGALFLSELAPVITLGRRASRGELLLPECTLRERGIDLIEVDRGGLATYHGPGQWVLFAVDRLERLTGDTRGVRRAVEGLLEIALRVSQLYEPRAEIRDGNETGVWSASGKLASVGVHIERGVLLHGLSLNCFRTQTSFAGIRPCGLDAAVDFLFNGLPEERHEGEFQRVCEELVRESSAVFW